MYDDEEGCRSDDCSSKENSMTWLDSWLIFKCKILTYAKGQPMTISMIRFGFAIGYISSFVLQRKILSNECYQSVDEIICIK